MNEVWIDFDRRVPMRDSIALSADVYRPKGDNRHPVILLRTPYLKTGDGQLKSGRYFAEVSPSGRQPGLLPPPLDAKAVKRFA